MNGASNWGQAVADRTQLVREQMPDSAACAMDFQLLDYDPANAEFTFLCKTYPWMRNLNDTLHGGFCAMVMDQAMGFVAYSIKPGEGNSPTISLQTNYHRPLLPGKEVLVKTRLVNMSRSLITLSSEAFHADAPGKLCISATGTFFYKPAQI